MNKCLGCGKTINDDLKYCERCFQIRNYNNHSIKEIISNNSEIIDKVNKTNYYTLFLCDLLNLNQRVVELYKKVDNKKLFVLTKMDVIPKNINIDKFINNIRKSYHLDDLILISIKNNYGIKELNNIILDNQNVLFMGPSSSGKSSLINYLFQKDLTISNHQNTTPDFNELNIDNLKIIDTPGLQINDNMISKQAGYLKPITIQLNKDYSLILNDYELSFEKDANITLYLDKNTKYKTIKKIVNSNKININNKSDIVIDNIGFVYVKENNILFINKNDHVEIRESLVGFHE